MQRIAFFIPNVGYGGAERVVINLLKEMSDRGLPLDLILSDTKGISQRGYLNQVPRGVRIINLEAKRMLTTIFPLSKYLQEQQPCAIVSHLSHANVAAVLAKQIARTNTKLVLVEHNTFSAHESKGFTYNLVKRLMKLLYSKAEFVVAVSEAAAQDLSKHLCLGAEKVKLIYNPVINNELFAKANAPLDHPWFKGDVPPVFLGVGRLIDLKDFATLIKAFAIVRKEKNARLLILGDGELRDELESLVQTLGLSKDVWLEGFVENPYAYMSQATAFVLSSRAEGLPTALIEAMACGCPVISTDCLSGPQEILEAGKYGALVPVGDEQAMAEAMLQVLAEPVMKKDFLVQRAVNIASFEKATTQYLALLNS